MGKALKKIAVVVGLAGLAGYVAGILTAPKSGRETRDDLKQAARSGLADAEKQLKKVAAELGSAIDEAKKRGGEMSDKAREELNDLADKARAAREKAREMVSAVHDGDAQDEDLKAAMTQANASLKHLRDYLKK